jgi:hypothetical protein
MTFHALRSSSLIALLLFTAAGCGSIVDGGAGVAPGLDGGACNTLSNDAPTIHPDCPASGSGVSCPDCPNGLAGGLGGVVADGTYFMTVMTFWASNCGEFAARPAQATLRVHGGIMEVVATDSLDQDLPPQTTRATFSFTTTGTTLSVQDLCSTQSTSYPLSPVPYTVMGKQLSLDSLPGVYLEPTTFELQ